MSVSEVSDNEDEVTDYKMKNKTPQIRQKNLKKKTNYKIADSMFNKLLEDNLKLANIKKKKEIIPIKL